jgi:hypothetical protein
MNAAPAPDGAPDHAIDGAPVPIDGVPPHALELRVHGVHGTSPNVMLGVDAKQVAGDSLTGIYRATDALPYRKLNAGHVVEAYSWGALTSGVQGFFGWVRRVLWLTLLPFAFVNVAYWSRFHLNSQDETYGREAKISARCIRWAGLLFTCLFVLAPCLVFIDLFAWQCYGGNASGCPRLPDFFDFMARFNAAQRMVIASLGPFAVLATLWSLSRTTTARYEAVDDRVAVRDMGPGHPLRSSHMWAGELRCRRLQYLHIGLGAATIVMFSGFQLVVTTPDTAGFLWATTGLASGVWVTAFVRTWVVDDEFGGRPIEAWDVWVPRAAILIALAHAAALWFVPLTETQEAIDFRGPFRNNNLWLLVVIAGLVALNTVLFVSRWSRPWVVRFATAIVVGVPAVLLVCCPLGVTNKAVLLGGLVLSIVVWLGLLLSHVRYEDKESARHESAAWRGAGPAVLLGAGMWVALLFTSALVIGVADYLNGSEHPVSQLDTKLDAVEAPVPKLGLWVKGDVVLSGAVIVKPTAAGDPIRVLGGVLTADSAIAPGKLPRDLFDHTVVEDGTEIALGEPDLSAAVGTEEAPVEGTSVVLVDSCVRAEGDEGVEALCRPSSRGFVAQASYDVEGSELIVSERALTLNFEAPPQRPLIVPQVLTWTPLIQLLWVLLVTAGATLGLIVFGRTAGRKIRGHVFGTDMSTPSGSLLEIRKRRVTAALAHRAEALTDIFAAVTTLLGLFLLVGTASGQPPWQLLPWTRQFGTVSLYATVGSSLLMILLGSYVRRSESTRKAVGILWDLTTFWPRAAHPLGPPCYAERVVPELTTRIQWALDKQALVVLSGHSQGSLIAVSVAARLSDDELKRVRLITYGSQVRALYGRVFPAVFGPQFMGNQPTSGAPTLREPFPDAPGGPDEITPYFSSGPDTLRARIGPEHWRNLFRRTDALGYRVFTDYDSSYDVPVREVPVAAVGDPGPRIGGHSLYQHTPEYRAIVGRWLREVPVEVPENVTPVEWLPIE